MMPTRRWHSGVRLVTLGLALFTGCASLQPAQTPELPPLPKKREVRVGPYLFVTDVDLKRDHSVLKDVEGLQDQICKELHLAPGTGVVHVYVFNDRPRYDQYMQAHFKNLPARRAFFMARSDERRGDELVVYTYWGDRIKEDLRHELTHALLHSTIKTVPMWLDEGLAEYFEVPPEWQGLNYRHLAALRSQPGIPWTPDLARLEKLTLVKEMSPADYRESWAWVHLMLRSTPQAKTALVRYLHQLRSNKDAGSLKPLLVAAYPDPEAALREHIGKLEKSTQSLPPVP